MPRASMRSMSPAMMAFSSPSRSSESNLRKARSLAYTCYQMFKSTASGLAPEKVTFSEKKDFDVVTGAEEYKLRADVLEVLFVLHETTKDPIYV